MKYVNRTELYSHQVKGKIPHPKSLPASEEGLQNRLFSPSSFTGRGWGNGAAKCLSILMLMM
jgi:hypothetical protein